MENDRRMDGFGLAYVELQPNRFRERWGLDFEGFRVGQVFRHRPGYTFSQQDNMDEAADTLNQAMLHYDEHYAGRTEFGRPLMVTTVIVKKVVGMAWKTFYRRKRIVRWREINMRRPVYGGDTLYAESEILEVADGDDPECGLLAVATRSLKPDGALTSEFIYEALIYRADCSPLPRLNY